MAFRERSLGEKRRFSTSNSVASRRDAEGKAKVGGRERRFEESNSVASRRDAEGETKVGGGERRFEESDFELAI